MISFKIRHVWEYFDKIKCVMKKNVSCVFSLLECPSFRVAREASSRRQTRERVAKLRELKGNPGGRKLSKIVASASFFPGPSLSLTRKYTMVYRRKESIPNGLAAVSLFSVHGLDVTLERYM